MMSPHHPLAHDHVHEHADHDHRGRAHGHAPASFDTAFAVGIGLNLTFVAVEFVYGVLANSVVLMADARAQPLRCSEAGYCLDRKRPDQTRPFGWLPAL
jgi:Co/Zn/Cd efflux system component